MFEMLIEFWLNVPVSLVASDLPSVEKGRLGLSQHAKQSNTVQH